MLNLSFSLVYLRDGLIKAENSFVIVRSFDGVIFEFPSDILDI